MTRLNSVSISCIAVVALLVLLTPWQSQIAPAWKIRVVDETGSPIPRLAVSENWIDPNFSMWKEEDFRSDENGFVSFPKRSTRQNLLLKTMSPIWNRLLFGKQSYDAMAFGWGSYSGGEAYYRSGQALPEKLVMHR